MGTVFRAPRARSIQTENNYDESVPVLEDDSLYSPELGKTIALALSKHYPLNGKFSLQQRITMSRFNLSKEALKPASPESTDVHDMAHALDTEDIRLWLTVRTIENACPLTEVDRVSFNYFQNDEASLLVQPLNNSLEALRRLHDYGAIEFSGDTLSLGSIELLTAHVGSNVDVAMDAEDESKCSWAGFMFSLAELPVTRKKCVVVHGVASILRRLHAVGLIKIIAEQEHFYTNSPYSLTAVLEIAE